MPVPRLIIAPVGRADLQAPAGWEHYLDEAPDAVGEDDRTQGWTAYSRPMGIHLLDLAANDPEELRRRVEDPTGPLGLAVPRLDAISQRLEGDHDRIMLLGSDQLDVNDDETDVRGDTLHLAELLVEVAKLRGARAIARTVPGRPIAVVEQLNSLEAHVARDVLVHRGTVVAVTTGGTPQLRLALASLVAALGGEAEYWAIVDQGATSSKVVPLATTSASRLYELTRARVLAQPARKLAELRCYDDLDALLTSGRASGKVRNMARRAVDLERVENVAHRRDDVPMPAGATGRDDLIALRLLAWRAVTARGQNDFFECCIFLRHVYERLSGAAGVERITDVDGDDFEDLLRGSGMYDVIQEAAHGRLSIPAFSAAEAELARLLSCSSDGALRTLLTRPRFLGEALVPEGERDPAGRLVAQALCSLSPPASAAVSTASPVAVVAVTAAMVSLLGPADGDPSPPVGAARKALGSALDATFEARVGDASALPPSDNPRALAFVLRELGSELLHRTTHPQVAVEDLISLEPLDRALSLLATHDPWRQAPEWRVVLVGVDQPGAVGARRRAQDSDLLAAVLDRLLRRRTFDSGERTLATSRLTICADVGDPEKLLNAISHTVKDGVEEAIRAGRPSALALVEVGGLPDLRAETAATLARIAAGYDIPLIHLAVPRRGAPEPVDLRDRLQRLAEGVIRQDVVRQLVESRRPRALGAMASSAAARELAKLATALVDGHDRPSLPAGDHIGRRLVAILRTQSDWLVASGAVMVHQGRWELERGEVSPSSAALRIRSGIERLWSGGAEAIVRAEGTPEQLLRSAFPALDANDLGAARAGFEARSAGCRRYSLPWGDAASADLIRQVFRCAQPRDCECPLSPLQATPEVVEHARRDPVPREPEWWTALNRVVHRRASADLAKLRRSDALLAIDRNPARIAGRRPPGEPYRMFEKLLKSLERMELEAVRK